MRRGREGCGGQHQRVDRFEELHHFVPPFHLCATRERILDAGDVQSPLEARQHVLADLIRVLLDVFEMIGRRLGQQNLGRGFL